jgi:hypothetical protein
VLYQLLVGDDDWKVVVIGVLQHELGDCLGKVVLDVVVVQAHLNLAVMADAKLELGECLGVYAVIGLGPHLVGY